MMITMFCLYKWNKELNMYEFRLYDDMSRAHLRLDGLLRPEPVQLPLDLVGDVFVRDQHAEVLPEHRPPRLKVDYSYSWNT
jgi:hypothetical protein